MTVDRLGPAIKILLRTQEVSRNDAAKLHAQRNSVSAALRRMHAQGLVRIARWERTRGGPLQFYTTADGKPDAPRPAPMTMTEKRRSSMKNPETRDKANARKRAARARAKVPRLGMFGV